MNIIFSYDYVLLRDGNSTSSSQIGKYCGNNIPPSSVSTGNELYIHFHTDVSTVRGGFNMSYDTIKGNSQFSQFS